MRHLLPVHGGGVAVPGAARMSRVRTAICGKSNVLHLLGLFFRARQLATPQCLRTCRLQPGLRAIADTRAWSYIAPWQLSSTPELNASNFEG
jgi:hypothetical protein